MFISSLHMQKIIRTIIYNEIVNITTHHIKTETETQTFIKQTQNTPTTIINLQTYGKNRRQTEIKSSFMNWMEIHVGVVAIARTLAETSIDTYTQYMGMSVCTQNRQCQCQCQAIINTQRKKVNSLAVDISTYLINWENWSKHFGLPYFNGRVYIYDKLFIALSVWPICIGLCPSSSVLGRYIGICYLLLYWCLEWIVCICDGVRSMLPLLLLLI